VRTCPFKIPACQRQPGACKPRIRACQRKICSCKSNLKSCKSNFGACQSGVWAGQLTVRRCQSRPGACQLRLNPCVNRLKMSCLSKNTGEIAVFHQLQPLLQSGSLRPSLLTKPQANSISSWCGISGLVSDTIMVFDFISTFW